MRTDRRPLPDHGGEIDLLEEIFDALVEPLQLEERIAGVVWDAAFLNPLRDILSRPGKGFRARLTEHAWALAGGRAEEFPTALTHAIELLHAGSLVVDDIEDDSRTRRGRPALHRRYGLPLALNTGNLLYFLALEHLGSTPVSADVRSALYREASAALIRCHQGQALDLSVGITGVKRSEVFELVDVATRLKTGSLMGLAAVLGAWAAGGSPGIVDVLRRFGVELGVGLQMLDDWSGVNVESRREKGIEDVRLARPTWPWAWLAESGDDLAYAETVHQARALSIDWQADRVRERLGTLLGPTAPGRIRAQIDLALRGLEAGLGGSAVLGAIEEDVDGLVRAFQGE